MPFLCRTVDNAQAKSISQVGAPLRDEESRSKTHLLVLFDVDKCAHRARCPRRHVGGEAAGAIERTHGKQSHRVGLRIALAHLLPAQRLELKSYGVDFEACRWLIAEHVDAGLGQVSPFRETVDCPAQNHTVAVGAPQQAHAHWCRTQLRVESVGGG